MKNKINAQNKWATKAVQTAMCFGLTLVTIASVAQSTETQTPPAPDAAPSTPTPSFFESIGNLLNKLKTAIPSQPQDQSQAQAQTDPTVKPTDTEISTNTPGKSTPFFDIDKLANRSSTVLDPECKVMVQPFAIEDNVASLALFAAKVKAQEMMSMAFGQSGTPLDMKALVKMAARSLNWMPMALEVELGQTLLKNEEVLEETKNADVKRTYAEARGMLSDIVKDLPSDVPYKFQIYVRPTSYGNASALPGGIILVDRDLFKKGANPDFARFVIAHEVAHILQRHQTRMYQARLADGIDSIESLSKLIGGANGNNPGALLVQATVLKKLFVSFTEDQELQADSCAVRMMSKRYPDPQLLDRKLELVSQKFGPIVAEQGDGPASNTVIEIAKYLGDGVFEGHPNTGKRKANLKRAVLLTSAVK